MGLGVSRGAHPSAVFLFPRRTSELEAKATAAASACTGCISEGGYLRTKAGFHARPHPHSRLFPPALHLQSSRPRHHRARRFYFECAAYAAVRQPLTDAATEWCKLSAEHTPDMGGFRQALHWAATDSQLLTPNGPKTAGDDLRKQALELYAKAKAIRHNKSMGAATQPTQST
jgi:hypothetical protein